MTNQDLDRSQPPRLAECGNAGSDGPPLVYPVEEWSGERHMRVEARRALDHVREYVLEALGRDRLVERAAKPAIKCRLEVAIDRLNGAAPVSIDADDYGFRYGCQTIVRYAVDRKLRKALGLTWADLISDILFLAEIGPSGANLPHAFEHPKTLDNRRRRKIYRVAAFPPSAGIID
jgi:hypothetical protein